MNPVLAYLVIGVMVVLLFGITIFVHELGHFLAALACGMTVKTFSIGMGPALWQRKVRGILFKIAWFPIGGYVSLPQLDPAGMEHVQGRDEPGDQPGTGPAGETGEPGSAEPESYPPIAFWKKVIVSVAGPLGNLLLAILLAYVIYWSPDEIPEEVGTQVGFVDTNTAAYGAGLRVGDDIRTVNGAAVSGWRDLMIECHLVGGASNRVTLGVARGDAVIDLEVPTERIAHGVYGLVGVEHGSICIVAAMVADGPAARAGVQPQDVVASFDGIRIASVPHLIELVASRRDQPTALEVDRAGKRVRMVVTPEFSDAVGRALIGVQLKGDEAFTMAWMRYKEPWAQIRNDAREIVRILKALTSRREGEARRAAGALSGPIGIIWILWAAVQSGLLNTLGFLRLLNVNLAVLNLMPLPVLDGGHIIFATWEGITRRPVHPKVINVLVNVFVVLLLAVFVLISVGDCRRLAGDRFSRLFDRFKPAAAVETGQPGSEPAATNATPDPAAGGRAE